MSKYSVKNRQLIRIQPNKCLQMLADHRTATIRLVERKNCFIFRWLKHAIERTFGRNRKTRATVIRLFSHATEFRFVRLWWFYGRSIPIVYLLFDCMKGHCLHCSPNFDRRGISFGMSFFNEWSFFRSKTCNWSVTEKKETVFLLWGVIGRQPDGNQSTSQTVDWFKILQRIDGKKWSRTNSNRS